MLRSGVENATLDASGRAPGHELNVNGGMRLAVAIYGFSSPPTHVCVISFMEMGFLPLKCAICRCELRDSYNSVPSKLN
jgi:hypothetical protein